MRTADRCDRSMTKETFTTCGEGFYSRTLRKSPAQKLPVQAAADADAPVAQPAAAPADDNSKSRWGWLLPTKLWSAQPVASDVAAEGDRDGASTVGPVAAAEKGLEVREEVAKLRVEQLAVTSSKLHTLSAALESKTVEHWHTKAAAAATQELSDAQARLEHCPTNCERRFQHF